MRPSQVIAGASVGLTLVLLAIAAVSFGSRPDDAAEGLNFQVVASTDPPGEPEASVSASNPSGSPSSTDGPPPPGAPSVQAQSASQSTTDPPSGVSPTVAPVTIQAQQATPTARAPAAPATSAPSPQVTSPASGSCHPDYLDCVPVAADVDCSELGGRTIRLRNIRVDPYDLDRGNPPDGIGCNDSSVGGGTVATTQPTFQTTRTTPTTQPTSASAFSTTTSFSQPTTSTTRQTTTTATRPTTSSASSTTRTTMASTSSSGLATP